MIAPAVVHVAALIFYPLFGLCLAGAVRCTACKDMVTCRQIDLESEVAPRIASQLRAVELGFLPVFATIRRDFHTLHGLIATERDTVNNLPAGLHALISIRAGSGNPGFDIHFPCRRLVRGA